MQVKLTFKEAFNLIQDASEQDPSFYGQKYVRFILSKMTCSDEGVWLTLPDGSDWPGAGAIH